MERYLNVNNLVNNLTNNAALKTYYTLLLMADTSDEKEAVDKRFWQKFEELPQTDKTLMRRALQAAEKQLLLATQKVHQEVKTYKAELEELKQAA